MEMELRIDLRPNIKPIIKAVLSLRGFLMLIIALAFVHTGINLLSESLLFGTLCFLAFFIFLFIGKKFLEQVFFKEYLLLNKNEIKIILKTFLQEKTTGFLIHDIKWFGFAGQQKYTHHTMHNEVFDITGLEAGEKELQFIIDHGTLEIETEKTKLRFGKNITSWDAEEIIKQVEEFYQRSFNQQTFQSYEI